MSRDEDRTASLLTPAKLAQFKPKPAASPAAWLDQLAADAGAQHVRALAQLRRHLAAQAGTRESAPALAALQELAAALDALDFSLLQQPRGFMARFTGKGKTAAAEFSVQYERIVAAAEAVKAQSQQVAKLHQGTTSASERTLVEFEVEFRAIDKIIDQGARWLQDMRNQLKARQASATDEAALRGVKEDAARCELLVARLKQLRAASSAAQQVQQQSQAAAQRRASFAQLMAQTLASDLKAWQIRLAPIAAAAGDSSSPALGLEGPRETQRELVRHVQQAIADAGQLEAQERAFDEALDQLDEQLRAAGAA